MLHHTNLQNRRNAILAFATFILLFNCTIITSQTSLLVLDDLSKEPIENADIMFFSTLIGSTDKFGIFIIPDSIDMRNLSIVKPNYINKYSSIHNSTVYLIPDKYSQKIPMLYRSQQRKYTTAAISNIGGNVLENITGTERLNSLAGRVPGVGLLQLDGLPDSEEVLLKIRGQHTFGNHPGVTVLVDGKRMDRRMLDPYDIESITVLKDAAATAMYGLMSGNGVVLINTKRGGEEKLKVNYNTTLSYQTPLRLPKFLDSYNYAVLYNEAMLNDDPSATPLYSLHDLQGYQSGKAPYAYPNVDWVNLFVSDYTIQNRHNLNLSGSSTLAKYYVSAGYVYNSGVFNVDKSINTYNTNSSLGVFNIHGNLELKINNYLSVNADIKAKKDKRNTPGYYSENYDTRILTSLYSTPNNAFQPITYKNELGGWYDGDNPYGLLNYNGYSIFETNFISTSIEAKYKLDKYIKGMSLFGSFSMNSATDYVTQRVKSFATYILNPTATIWYKRGDDTPITSAGSYISIARNYDHMFGLNYDHVFGNNTIDFTLLAQRQQFKQNLYSSIGEVFQGLKSYASYRYDNKYLVDLTIALEGSNYFPSNKRYGLFPALSVGWIISEEDFMKNVSQTNFLKLRGSLGQAGNTIGTAWATYYGYMSNFSTGPGAIFGTSITSSTGMYQSRVANERMTWERHKKMNLGIDFSFFRNRLLGSVDGFYEQTNNILISNAISAMYGADIWIPEGKMENKGFEFELTWQDRVNEFSYFISPNLSFARNKTVNKNEEYREYTWMYETGHPYGSRFGYVFDRFFTEDDNLDDLPSQALLGTVRPGDLKFKDLNGDGIIDENDRTFIGKSKFPEIFYAMNVGLAHKGFDFNVLFQGGKNSSTYNSGYTFSAFHNKIGNVTSQHLSRWTPGSGQSASYPRLSLTDTNNTQTNSFWVTDNSFLRLKLAEIGYTFPTVLSKKINASKIRIFLLGSNLLTWDNVKFKDPEGEDAALRYPNVRTISCGLNVIFK